MVAARGEPSGACAYPLHAPSRALGRTSSRSAGAVAVVAVVVAWPRLAPPDPAAAGTRAAHARWGRADGGCRSERPATTRRPAPARIRAGAGSVAARHEAEAGRGRSSGTRGDPSRPARGARPREGAGPRRPMRPVAVIGRRGASGAPAGEAAGGRRGAVMASAAGDAGCPAACRRAVAPADETRGDGPATAGDRARACARPGRGGVRLRGAARPKPRRRGPWRGCRRSARRSSRPDRGR